MSAARSETKNTLVSADIVPVTSKRRTLSGLGFANIWIGMAIVISVFSFGASGIDGMGIWGVVTATLVANLLIAVIASLMGDIGVEHGLSFATYLRAPFGIAGVHLPAIARGVVAACWFGINTYIGVAVMPWKILDQLFVYLGYFGTFLSALAGIMLCDYYVIRRRRLNVQELYRADGQYRYHGGVNLCGIAAWGIGTLAAHFGTNYGYFFGFPVAFIVYYAMMKLWYLKRFPQAEVDSGYDAKYLGISVGNDWTIPGFEKEAGAEEGVPSAVQAIDVSMYHGGAVYEAATGHPLILTIGRQYGSNGRKLAGILAEKLDLPYYDKDMIRLASKELNVDESVVKRANETPNNDLVSALSVGGMFAGKGYEHEASKSDIMFQVQSQIIRDLAKKSSCIIVGRCANRVLEAAHVPTVDIFVVADHEDRVRTIMKRENLSEREARARIAKVETRRAAYYNYYTGKEWGNPQYYDLCVNTSGKDLDILAEHIIGYIQMNQPESPTPLSTEPAAAAPVDTTAPAAGLV